MFGRTRTNTSVRSIRVRVRSSLMGVPGRKRTGAFSDDGTPLSTTPRTMGRQSIALDGNPMNFAIIGRKMGQKRESRAISIIDSDDQITAHVMKIF